MRRLLPVGTSIIIVTAIIASSAPRFRGYRQQDSQELLRHLLDGMDLEERQVRYCAHKLHVHLLTSLLS
jgi:ubiquitin C-terminal hydrolase